MVYVCRSEPKIFFCKQRTAYEMRISDWSSVVCSSDLVIGLALEARDALDAWHRMGRKRAERRDQETPTVTVAVLERDGPEPRALVITSGDDLAAELDVPTEIELVGGVVQIGRAACRERVWQYVWIWVVAV